MAAGDRRMPRAGVRLLLDFATSIRGFADFALVVCPYLWRPRFCLEFLSLFARVISPRIHGLVFMASRWTYDSQYEAFTGAATSCILGCLCVIRTACAAFNRDISERQRPSKGESFANRALHLVLPGFDTNRKRITKHRATLPSKCSRQQSYDECVNARGVWRCSTTGREWDMWRSMPH